MNSDQYRVPAALLRSSIDMSWADFETTENVAPLEATIGQDRAVRALSFGLRMGQEGYNIYASGAPGTGKSTLVRSLIGELAEKQEVPPDWCYVYNFQNPENPCAISLKAGEGRVFRKDMHSLIQFLRKKIPEVFQSKEYTEEHDQIMEKGNRAKQALFQEIVAKGHDHGFEIKGTRTGFSFMPTRKGKRLTQEEVQQLSAEERQQIEEKQKLISDDLRDLMLKFQELDRETEADLEKHNQGAVNFAVEGRLRELLEKYKDHEKITGYLKEVKQDLLQHFKGFLPSQQEIAILSQMEEREGRHQIRYQVNLLVDNGKTEGAPLVEESNPTYTNLVGRIEKKARFGTLQTDFTLIRSGALLKANGGYLVLHILDLLTHPFSWEALKKTLEKKELVIEDIGELYGVIATSGLKPEPIPINLKVVVIGNPYLHALLQYYDEDFSKLFKIKADFSTRTAKTDAEMMKFAQFVGRVCREEGLNHLDRSALQELFGLISRMVGHKERLSLRFNEVSNLIREASFWSAESGAGIVSAEHVEKAFEEQVYRSNLMEERLQEEIDEQVVMIDVEGTQVGQVNGLVVYALGDYSFGKPSRITSRTYLGRKGVVNVERESELSGKTHSKGVVILANYLGGRYAQQCPLSLSASLAFEQSYGEVDGDSASAGELIAILSSVAGIPIKQSLAITGSVNQHGAIQPIGGVNEKIEGFFQSCRNRGLTGDQGVLIPHQNVAHLQLKREVVEAVEAGTFHIYQVRHVDEALTLLTGMEAGARQEDGSFPSGTVNARVQQAFIEMHEKMEENHDEEEEEN
jgi:lon-related putative ATP-dependent protease